MPKCENPAMNAVKLPALQASDAALPLDSRFLELDEGDDPMLPGGNLRNEGISVGIANFCMHVHA